MDMSSHIVCPPPQRPRSIYVEFDASTRKPQPAAIQLVFSFSAVRVPRCAFSRGIEWRWLADAVGIRFLSFSTSPVILRQGWMAPWDTNDHIQTGRVAERPTGRHLSRTTSLSAVGCRRRNPRLALDVDEWRRRQRVTIGWLDER